MRSKWFSCYARFFVGLAASAAALIFVYCSDDPLGAGKGTPLVETREIAVSSEGEKELDSASESLVLEALWDYSRLQYRATVLINSGLWADLDKTDFAVVASRDLEALDAIDSVLEACKRIVTLEETVIMPAVQKALGKRRASSASSGDIDKARRLVNMYMNPQEYGPFKANLSDISRKTGVAMKRLRMMVNQHSLEANAAVDAVDADEAQTRVDRMETIRDASITTNTVLATYASGGLAAGAGKAAKTIFYLEKANSAISITEYGLNVSIGSENVPPALKTAFKANSYAGIAFSLKGAFKDADDYSNAFVAISGTVPEAVGGYLTLTDQGTLSQSPSKHLAQTIIPNQSIDTVAARYMVLDGDYRIPNASTVGPDIIGFNFDEVSGELTDDQLLLDQQKLLDLIDHETATSDNFTWDPRSRNPETNYTSAYVASSVAQTALSGDPVLTDAKLIDPRGGTQSSSVTIKADPILGAYPRLAENQALRGVRRILRAANFSEPFNYFIWTFSDGTKSDSSSSAQKYHSFPVAGTVTISCEGSHFRSDLYPQREIESTTFEVVVPVPPSIESLEVDSVGSTVPAWITAVVKVTPDKYYPVDRVVFELVSAGESPVSLIAIDTLTDTTILLEHRFQCLDETKDLLRVIVSDKYGLRDTSYIDLDLKAPDTARMNIVIHAPIVGDTLPVSVPFAIERGSGFLSNVVTLKYSLDGPGVHRTIDLGKRSFPSDSIMPINTLLLACPGDYTVSIEVDNGFGSKLFTKNITVDPEQIAYPKQLQTLLAGTPGWWYDTLFLAPGVYTPVHLWGRVLSSLNPKDPESVANTIIDANQNGRALQVESRTRVMGLTIKGGRTSGNGGGVLLSEDSFDVLFSDCVFTDNQADTGGAVGGSVVSGITFQNCVFRNNRASYGGAAWIRGGYTMNACTVSTNTAQNVAGGLASTRGILRIINSHIENNSATTAGGIYAGSVLEASGSIIRANQATGVGGGLFLRSAYDPHQLSALVVTGNSAARAGGIYTSANNSTEGDRALQILIGSGNAVSGNSATEATPKHDRPCSNIEVEVLYGALNEKFCF